MEGLQPEILALLCFQLLPEIVNLGVAGEVATELHLRHAHTFPLAFGLRLLLEGLVDIIVGVAAVLVPAAAVWAFVLLLAVWALVTGGLMIAAAFRLHLHYGRWWLVLGGVVSILFGIALILEPGMSALVLTWWIGSYTFAFGVLLLILAFQLRSRHGSAGPSITPPGR